MILLRMIFIVRVVKLAEMPVLIILVGIYKKYNTKTPLCKAFDFGMRTIDHHQLFKLATDDSQIL